MGSWDICQVHVVSDDPAPQSLNDEKNNAHEVDATVPKVIPKQVGEIRLRKTLPVTQVQQHLKATGLISESTSDDAIESARHEDVEMKEHLMEEELQRSNMAK